jgi:hypothetical protein
MELLVKKAAYEKALQIESDIEKAWSEEIDSIKDHLERNEPIPSFWLTQYHCLLHFIDNLCCCDKNIISSNR